MPDIIKGIAKIDKRTKDLVKRLQSGDIAIISHQDIDAVAAESLIQTGIKVVINVNKSMSGLYPNPGPQILMDKGISIIDVADEVIMKQIKEGDLITIIEDKIYCNDELIVTGHMLTLTDIDEKMAEAKGNLEGQLEKFVENTLDYAKREKDIILGKLNMPQISTYLKEKQVLVVVRGKNYREDLYTIRSYIREVKPVLIGVDGGADALVECGYQPDIIVGDMDSISDKTLASGAEIIVHAYPNGKAPGLQRVKELGLEAKVFPAPGTSEDIAMLLAFEEGANLIVAVGTHSNMIDFLEKGRKGMSSTFLVRLKVGAILVDAKGVSSLYRTRMKFKYVILIGMAATIPLMILLSTSPIAKQYLTLLWMKIRIIFGV